MRLACLLAFAFAVATAPAYAQGLSDLRSDYRHSKDHAERLETVEKIAALFAAGAPKAVEVTTAVAEALHDDAFTVRIRAAQLLGGGLDTETAIEALVKVTRYYERDLKDETERLENRRDALLAKPGIDAAAQAQVAAQARTGLVRIHEYHDALVVALAARRDGRCVEGIGALLEARPLSDMGFDKLLAYGTQQALDQIVLGLVAYEKLLDDRAKERRIAERRKPGRMPYGWGRGREAWNAREEKRLAGLLAQFDARSAEIEAWDAGLRERLREFAETNRLRGPPRHLTPARAWRSWVSKARGVLPKSFVE